MSNYLAASLTLSLDLVRESDCELSVGSSLCSLAKESICVCNLIRDGSNQSAAGLNTAWNQSRPSRD